MESGSRVDSNSFLADKDAAGVSITSESTAVSLLCCMSFGVGVFTMPTVFNSVGWPMGVALILFFGAFSTLVMCQVLDVAVKNGCKDPDSFAALVPGGRFIAFFGMVLALPIANAAHLLLVSGMLFDLLEWFVTGANGEYSFDDSHKSVLLVIFIGIALPFCFLEDLGSFRYVSKAVSGTIIVTSVVVVVNCIVLVCEGKGASASRATPAGPVTMQSFAAAAPSICFAYSSMYQLFDVFAEMDRGLGPTEAAHRMRRSVIKAGILITMLYLVVAVSCVWAFGQDAGVTHKGSGSGNVLYNFKSENYLLTGLCFCLVAAMVLDYPIINMPLVNVVKHRLELAAMNWKYTRQALSVTFAVLIIALDVVVPDLGDVFGLCGSLGMSNYCYIAPGLVLLKAGKSNATRSVGIASLVLGFFMLFVSTGVILQGIFQKKA